MLSGTLRILEHVDARDPGGVVGLYLYGSATASGLRQDSDVDLLMITRRSLSTPERAAISRVLLDYSGHRAAVEPGRPVELTVVVHETLTTGRFPPACDYQYGEWLRAEIAGGQLPAPHLDPDLVILLASARASAIPLRGPAAPDVIEPILPGDLTRAIREGVEAVVRGFDGDERNVLLTLARMVVTLETGEIVPKETAAARVLVSLPAPYQRPLDLARQGYVGEAIDDWTDLKPLAREAAAHLASRIRER